MTKITLISNKNYFLNFLFDNKISIIRKLIKFNKKIDKFDKICLLHILIKKYVNCRLCRRTTSQMAADHLWSADHRLRTAVI